MQLPVTEIDQTDDIENFMRRYKTWQTEPVVVKKQDVTYAEMQFPRAKEVDSGLQLFKISTSAPRFANHKSSTATKPSVSKPCNSNGITPMERARERKKVTCGLKGSTLPPGKSSQRTAESAGSTLPQGKGSQSSEVLKQRAPARANSSASKPQLPQGVVTGWEVADDGWEQNGFELTDAFTKSEHRDEPEAELAEKEMYGAPVRSQSHVGRRGPVGDVIGLLLEVQVLLVTIIGSHTWQRPPTSVTVVGYYASPSLQFTSSHMATL
ncbi:hypothetical protein CYMTET_27786 [Cymbomonas tetramitiformis]|uniref:Uncharacterized protein n=1 Tax=Cymbomonas tetramitiformis TaxID=36881 RepID=A0AAE0KWL0_9CHLO|nr:hypothetical protein CYMTET_27786 [Cymbomonas tetramitiformis]